MFSRQAQLHACLSSMITQREAVPAQRIAGDVAAAYLCLLSKPEVEHARPRFLAHGSVVPTVITLKGNALRGKNLNHLSFGHSGSLPRATEIKEGRADAGNDRPAGAGESPPSPRP